MNNFVFLGAPGVGKGTMSEAICKDQGYTHISTGDLLRAELAAGSEIGKTAKGFMDRGKLVPDSLVAELLTKALRERLSGATGFIFDGYPRTVPQADLLARTLADLELELAGVVLLEAEQELILKRLTGRRVCRDCGAIFHLLFGPPRQAGICDACGGEVYQRGDDNETSVRQRLIEYDRQTKPLIDYYDQRHLLLRVDASEGREANYRTLRDSVDRWLATR